MDSKAEYFGSKFLKVDTYLYKHRSESNRRPVIYNAHLYTHTLYEIHPQPNNRPSTRWFTGGHCRLCKCNPNPVLSS